MSDKGTQGTYGMCTACNEDFLVDEATVVVLRDCIEVVCLQCFARYHFTNAKRWKPVASYKVVPFAPGQKEELLDAGRKLLEECRFRDAVKVATEDATPKPSNVTGEPPTKKTKRSAKKL